MSKIFGLDLGTNSIGWALRNTDLTDNQIENFGVLTFNKGVGNGKTGEYSYAAERTKKRSGRRLYQARKYRLWATLEHLIAEDYCPLSMEDLNKWRHYNKEEAYKNNNGGRVYPVWNAVFDAWIKLDFDNDGKPDYTSPYQLRKELAEIKLDFAKEENRFKLGRALYHIAQRRGFKSSRKGADDTKEKETNDSEVMDLQYSEKKKNKVIAELFEKYSEAKTIGWLFAIIECLPRNENSIRALAKYVVLKTNDNEIKELLTQFEELPSTGNKYRNELSKLIGKKYSHIKEEFLRNKGFNDRSDEERIRENKAQYAIRENYKDEIKFIFQFQGLKFEDALYTKLVETGKNKNDGSIFYKRPLRSQKGLIGKCTLEPNKYRAPVSHPAFETFRAWSFLNNIKYKENNKWKQLPLELKQEIYAELFFRKSKTYFPFSEIITFLKKKGKNWDLNYKPKATVTACPFSARLKDIFGDDYLNVKITKDTESKSGKYYYDIEDIWHVLFSYEDQEFVAEFAEQKLKLEPEKIKQFVIAWNALPVGYGMLSINAINKINVFLEKGLIYTEAVLLANIPKVIENGLWRQNEELLLSEISNVIAENRQQKSILNIVNGLISKYKNLEANEKFGYKDNNYQLIESDLNNIPTAIEEQFSAHRWNDFSDELKKEIFGTVKGCYQAYFSKQGIVRDSGSEERIVTVQSNGKNYYKTETGYYRLPKLIDTLGEFLLLNFNVDEKQIQKIYHPSEINIYPPAKPDKDGILKLESPKTGSFKNPMAMRTLHELRKLMNYMIETNQIDNETRIVVEVARDLNDANKRWAIEAWQRERERENAEFASKIKEFRDNDSEVSASDIDKARLLIEQQIDEVENNAAFELKVIMRDIYKKKKERDAAEKNLIRKYRLWLEQGMQCLYTGNPIKLTDLFKDNIVDFEHTVPRSKSFDNSLANLTVCFADYNRTIKKNQIPSQLPNYSENSGGYTAILPRLKAWEEKVERIKQQIDFWKTKSKKAADKTGKDNAIRQRHLWQMELDYWQNKLDRFTITEITSGFKNSQKVDTQLISKYAFHYLKTYFDKVDVQKGSITAEFRKIYQLQASDEKKDRSQHSHHAKDAAVLTLIPVAAKRDAILEKYYEAKENKTSFTPEPPFAGFKREFVWGIDDSILINNITNNQALTPAKRKVRKRGKEVFIEKADGTKVQKWATGDSIRRQLHQETFYGAIKPAKRGKNGNIEKDENGKFVQEEKVKYVLRVPFNADFAGVDKIVDEGLKKQIQEQAKRAGSFKKAFEEGIYLLDKNGKPHGNKIRHIRVFKDGEVKEPLAIKKQTNLSDKEYKQSYWAANGGNFAYGLYENDRKQRGFKLISLFDVTELKKTANNLKEMFEQEIEIQSPKAKVQLKYILISGRKVLFYKENLEELQDLSNDIKQISNRLYVIDGFEKDGRIRFSHNLDSRSVNDLKELEWTFGKGYWQGLSQVNFDTPMPKLKLSKGTLNFVLEGYDFEMKMDGTIKWFE